MEYSDESSARLQDVGVYEEPLDKLRLNENQKNALKNVRKRDKKMLFFVNLGGHEGKFRCQECEKERQERFQMPSPKT